MQLAKSKHLPLLKSTGWTLPVSSPMGAISTSTYITAYSSGPQKFMQTPLQDLVNQIEAGTLTVAVGKTLKLDEIVEAHTMTDEIKAGGKLVVLP